MQRKVPPHAITCLAEFGEGLFGNVKVDCSRVAQDYMASIGLYRPKISPGNLLGVSRWRDNTQVGTQHWVFQ